MTRTQVMFLIWQLGRGGAERQLIELTRGMNKTRFAITVVTVADGGGLLPQMEAIEDVNIMSLHCSSRWDTPLILWRLWRVVLKIQPDILHGYTPVPNLFCLIIGKLRSIPVIWGVRTSNRELSRYPVTTRWSYALSDWLASYPALVITNSRAACNEKTHQGYPTNTIVAIPNGIDVERFRPDSQTRQECRRLWNISEDHLMIGLVGRLDPVKDHSTFLEAATLIARQLQAVRFVCIGSGPHEYAQRLYRQAAHLGIAHLVQWFDSWDDMPAAYNAFDLNTCCSHSEGFANVVGEAMACGVPCVVTDVGDSAWIVGNTGVVVPPGHPRALAAGWLLALARDTPVLRQQCRQRVFENFSTQRLVAQTEEVLERVLK